MLPKNSGPDHVTPLCFPEAAHLFMLQLALVNPRPTVLETTCAYGLSSLSISCALETLDQSFLTFLMLQL